MAVYRNVPYYIIGTKEALGHAVGQAERSSMSIEDQGLAEAMIKNIDGGSANVR